MPFTSLPAEAAPLLAAGMRKITTIYDTQAGPIMRKVSGVALQ